MLAAADRRLTELRRAIPDAGGLVIATDHEAARAYAKMLRAVTGQGATIVLSDDPTASKKIKQFGETEDRWMVAVRMVSEGVDIPRLCVGVYATSTSTPLFFAQAIGRFVRARKRGETASVFLPSVPTLMGHASEMEEERDHVLTVPSARTAWTTSCSPRRTGSRTRPTSARSCRSRRWRRPPRSTGSCTTAASSG